MIFQFNRGPHSGREFTIDHIDYRRFVTIYFVDDGDHRRVPLTDIYDFSNCEQLPEGTVYTN